MKKKEAKEAHQKKRKNKKREKEKKKMREKERRDNATILFTTLVLQSSAMIFMIESLLCCHFHILVGIFHYRTWLVYSWASKLDAHPLSFFCYKLNYLAQVSFVGERCRKLKFFLRFHQDPSMSSSSNEWPDASTHLCRSRAEAFKERGWRIRTRRDPNHQRS